MLNPSPVGRQQFLDANGKPLAGGLIFTFAAGTSTPLATFTDAGGLTPNSNPIVLDSGGFAGIWLNPILSYKFTVQNALGVTQWTVDNIPGGPTQGGSKASVVGTGAFTIPAGVSVLKVTAVGGGGAGGGSTVGGNSGSGGGSGGATIQWLTGLTPGNTLTVTLGAGGAGVSTAAGGAGGATTVASGSQTIVSVIANGGPGGVVTAPSSVGAAGAAPGSGGQLNLAGNPGSNSTATFGGHGGGSILGGGGQGSIAAGGSNAAQSFGGGGGGAAPGANGAGGAGFAGTVIFEFVA